MLQLTVRDLEFFDEDTQEFKMLNQTIVLEHSLLSISKWEAKWKKTFFTKHKTMDEFIDYVRCMTITSNVSPVLYRCLTDSHIKSIQEYIDDPMTATTIKSLAPKMRRNRSITSELVYCWMFTQNIPIECEKWHFNRLMTLIQVCSIENNPKQKKMSKRDILRQNSSINAARRARYGTRG